MLLFVIITKLFYFFIVCLIITLIVLNTINLGILGKTLNFKVTYLLENHINMVIILAFFMFLLLQYKLSLNVIFLDNDVVVKTYLENNKFEIKGEAIQIISDNLGSAAVFTVAIRIAAALVSKSAIGILPKIGYIGGTGAGFTILYKFLVPASSTITNIGSASASYSTVSRPIEISLEQIEHIDTKKPINELLTNFFDLNNNLTSSFRFNRNLDLAHKGEVGINREYIVDTDYNNTSKVLKALDDSNPNWRDQFISSPLENNDIIQMVIDLLSNHLLMYYIILYLLIVLLILLMIKLLVSDKNKTNIYNLTEKLKNLPAPLGYIIGKPAGYIIDMYILAWQKSSNIWIFLLNINLILFISGSIYSLLKIIAILQNIVG